MPTLVEVVPYDPKWSKDFLDAEVLLRNALGQRAVTIEHIGSAAVPGLSAKPIIDIDVTLSGPGDVPEASAALIGLGSEPRGNRYDDGVWAFLFKGSLPQLRVYLCPPANQTHERRILLRDYLRRHEDVALAYATLKLSLAKRFPYDGDRYTAEKTAFIARIVRAAQGAEG